MDSSNNPILWDVLGANLVNGGVWVNGGCGRIEWVGGQAIFAALGSVVTRLCVMRAQFGH